MANLNYQNVSVALPNDNILPRSVPGCLSGGGVNFNNWDRKINATIFGKKTPSHTALQTKVIVFKLRGEQ